MFLSSLCFLGVVAAGFHQHVMCGSDMVSCWLYCSFLKFLFLFICLWGWFLWAAPVLPLPQFLLLVRGTVNEDGFLSCIVPLNEQMLCQVSDIDSGSYVGVSYLVGQWFLP